jgi:dsRNA-specific ribonuclease
MSSRVLRFSLASIGDREQFRARLRHFQRDITPQQIRDSRTVNGVRGRDFQEFIAEILVNRCDLSEKTAAVFVSEPYIYTFEKAFTSPSVNPCENYELLETKGDVGVNKAVVDYLTEAYPQFDCPHAVRIFADIKSKFASKSVLSLYADSLGFEKFITVKQLVKESLLDSVLEDVFEAFVGALDDVIRVHSEGMNVGYPICYNFVKSVLSQTEMSFKYTDLVDAKTRLKELFQHLNNQSLRYTSPTEPLYETVITGVVNGQRREIVRESANNKKKSIDTASSSLLNLLQRGMTVGGIDTRVIDKAPSISEHAISVASASIDGGPRMQIGKGESFSKQHADTIAATQALAFLASRGIAKPAPWQGDFTCDFCKL